MGNVQHNTLDGADLHVSKEKFVARNVNVADFAIGDFTTDNNNHIDGLDLTAIVPAGAVAVLLRLEYNSANIGDLGRIMTDIGAAAETKMGKRIVIAFTAEETVFVLPLESNRLMDYSFAAGTTAIKISVLGWFT